MNYVVTATPYALLPGEVAVQSWAAVEVDFFQKMEFVVLAVACGVVNFVVRARQRDRAHHIEPGTFVSAPSGVPFWFCPISEP